MADRDHSFQSPPRRDPPAGAAAAAHADPDATEQADSPVYSTALAHQHALSMSAFASSGSGGVVLSSAAAVPATIPVPHYRASLPPRPSFRLWSLLRPRRDMGGDRRAGDTEGRYASPHGQAHMSTRGVLSSGDEAPLSLQERLRYGGLLLHPQRPLHPKHLYALVLFFLALLPCIGVLFALAALLACSPAGASLLAPLCAAWIVAAGLAMFGGYVGAVGPFACAMERPSPQQRREAPIAQRSGVTDLNGAGAAHRWLPARFPAGVGAALAVVCTQALMFSMLAGNEFGELCQLRDSISVNDAPAYSTLLASAESGPLTPPRSDGMPALRTNDGSSRSDSGSTRAFLSFRDGFIETRMVRAFNVSDVEVPSPSSSGSPSRLPLVLDGSPGVAGITPTRMLLLAPIWASFRDPFYARVVPAWACASFSWGRETRAQRDSAAKLVEAWSAPWRFGITVHALDPDYRVYQDLIASSLGASGMNQMGGAPLLYWSDPAPLEAEATRMAWVYVSASALLTLLLWGGTGLAHVRWYRSMLRQEAEWEEAATKRRARLAVQVRASSPAPDAHVRVHRDSAPDSVAPAAATVAAGGASAGSTPDERKHGTGGEVELASLARPMSPSGSVASHPDGDSVVSPSLVRPSSRSSAPSTFLAEHASSDRGVGPGSGAGTAERTLPSRPGSISVPAAWWKGVWPFANRGASSSAVSPGSIAAGAPLVEESPPTPRSHPSRLDAYDQAPSTLVPSSPIRPHASLHLSALRDGHDRPLDGPGPASPPRPPLAALSDSQMISPHRHAARGQRTVLSPLSGRTRWDHALAHSDPSTSSDAAAVPITPDALPSSQQPQPQLQPQAPQTPTSTQPSFDDTDVSDRSEDSLVRAVSLERSEVAHSLGLSNRSPRARLAASGSGNGTDGRVPLDSSHPFSSS